MNVRSAAGLTFLLVLLLALGGREPTPTNTVLLTERGLGVEHEPWEVQAGTHVTIHLGILPSLLGDADVPAVAPGRLSYDPKFNSERFANLLDPDGVLRWEVYFVDTSPFGTARRPTMSYVGTAELKRGGRLEIQLGVLERTGHFKYGVRVWDDATGRLIHDFDPALLGID